MAVPTSGNFEMFGTGSNTTIAGAMHNTGDNVTGIENFDDLKAAANSGKFDFTYAGEIQFPDLDISASLQFRGYPVDPGNCRAIWVDDTVNQSRYGARYRLPSGQPKDTLYGSLFGSPYTYGGNSGTVYNVCSTLVPSTWDSVTQTIVDLGGLVVNFADGGNCYINTDCVWIAPTITPTPTITITPTPTITTTQTIPAGCNQYYIINTTGVGLSVTFTSTNCTSGATETRVIGPDGFELICSSTIPVATVNADFGDVTYEGPCSITPTPTITTTPTPTSTPVYYYILENCANSAQLQYGYSTVPSFTTSDTFNYNGNCYKYYDVDPNQLGNINLDLLTSCACPTPTPTPTPVNYYYILENCANSSQLQYGYSTTPSFTTSDSFNYNSNCYKYYDVDPNQLGNINLDLLTSCICPTPTPTPTPTTTALGCFTYSIQNNDLNQTLTFQYRDCDGNLISDVIVPADSGTPDFCAEEGSVSRQSGTFSWVLTTEAVTCIEPTPTPTGTSTSTPTPTPTVTCNCITVDVLNSQLQSGGNDLYYIVNDCTGGARDVNLGSGLGEEQDGSTYFGICSSGTTSNLFKYGPSGSPFVGLPGMNVSPNLTVCTVDLDCLPVLPEPATPTPTPTVTSTPTPTVTPTPITPTPTSTPVTPTPTSTPVTPTPTSTPTPSCPTETLGDGPTSGDACNDFHAATGTVRYLDGPFPFASVIYRNPDCTGSAAAGYYSDGGVWRYWNGSSFTMNGSCGAYNGGMV